MFQVLVVSTYSLVVYLVSFLRKWIPLILEISRDMLELMALRAWVRHSCYAMSSQVDR
uniref:Uncharacterized protein n=1 Tax=Utricularia reniformis TaxID=192314 RepID=A0A1Y0AZM7_9LAMI|nr:hypothetical protein AEK19_MT0314 [Utricularia reniformis]ART30589.1 hypothetical protein AEK19_MT0314 [Utricularia reniformis]